MTFHGSSLDSFVNFLLNDKDIIVKFPCDQSDKELFEEMLQCKMKLQHYLNIIKNLKYFKSYSQVILQNGALKFLNTTDINLGIAKDAAYKYRFCFKILNARESEKTLLRMDGQKKEKSKRICIYCDNMILIDENDCNVCGGQFLKDYNDINEDKYPRKTTKSNKDNIDLEVDLFEDTLTENNTERKESSDWNFNENFKRKNKNICDMIDITQKEDDGDESQWICDQCTFINNTCDKWCKCCEENRGRKNHEKNVEEQDIDGTFVTTEKIIRNDDRKIEERGDRGDITQKKDDGDESKWICDQCTFINNTCDKCCKCCEQNRSGKKHEKNVEEQDIDGTFVTIEKIIRNDDRKIEERRDRGVKCLEDVGVSNKSTRIDNQNIRAAEVIGEIVGCIKNKYSENGSADHMKEYQDKDKDKKKLSETTIVVKDSIEEEIMSENNSAVKCDFEKIPSGTDIRVPIDKWTCVKCGFFNTFDHLDCKICDWEAPHKHKWRCEECTFVNEVNAPRCLACGRSNEIWAKERNIGGDSSLLTCWNRKCRTKMKGEKYCVKCGLDQSMKSKNPGDMVFRKKNNVFQYVWICTHCGHITDVMYRTCERCTNTRFNIGMRICSYCGWVLSSNSRYCTKCTIYWHV